MTSEMTTIICITLGVWTAVGINLVVALTLWIFDHFERG